MKGLSFGVSEVDWTTTFDFVVEGKGVGTDPELVVVHFPDGVQGYLAHKKPPAPLGPP